MHNIATPLLLLLWYAMLCFYISGRLNATAPVHPFAAAFQNNEELSPEDQDQSTAWTEQTAPTAVTCAADSPLPLYTSINWTTLSAQLCSSLKTAKVLRAFSCAALHFRILPNGP